MVEGAIAHYNRPPDDSRQCIAAVVIPSFLLSGPVHIVYPIHSFYTYFLHCTFRKSMYLVHGYMCFLHYCVLHTRIHVPSRKEHVL